MASSAAVAEPNWLADRRAAARGALGELQMPSFRGTAGWEFTPVDKLDLDTFEVAPGGDGEAFDDALTIPAQALRASGEHGPDGTLAEGVLVLSLATAAERHPELVQPHLGSVVSARTPLVARNDADWTDGWLVYVPRDTVVPDPIVLTTVHERAGSALHHRLLIVLEDGAEAEVWHQALSAPGADGGLVNGVVELVSATAASFACSTCRTSASRHGSSAHSARSSGATATWTGRRLASAEPTARCSSRPSSPGAARTRR